MLGNVFATSPRHSNPQEHRDHTVHHRFASAVEVEPITFSPKACRRVE